MKMNIYAYSNGRERIGTGSDEKSGAGRSFGPPRENGVFLCLADGDDDLRLVVVDGHGGDGGGDRAFLPQRFTQDIIRIALRESAFRYIQHDAVLDLADERLAVAGEELDGVFRIFVRSKR